MNSDNATVTPSEQSSYLEDSFTIDCREDNGYCFFGWQVFDENDEEIADYSDLISIADISKQNTTVKVLKTGTIVTLKPKLIRRPQVISSSPAYIASGVVRNSRIEVMFSEEMDLSSIYYDEKKATDLQSAGNILLTTSDNKCYGYVDTEGNIFYKNITIVNFNKTSENLLEYYSEPVFNPDFPQVLQISANPKKEPAGNKNILVTISKDFSYKDSESSLLVPLADNFSFSYRTNLLTDKTPPTFCRYNEQENDFVIRFVPENNTDNKYSNEWKSVSDTESFTSTDLADINCGSGSGTPYVFIKDTVGTISFIYNNNIKNYYYCINKNDFLSGTLTNTPNANTTKFKLDEENYFRLFGRVEATKPK